MDRVTKIRSAYPELTDDQARGLLISCYQVYTNEGFQGEVLQTWMDKATENICNCSISHIGEMLEAINL